MSIIVILTKDEVRLCALLAVERWLIKSHSVDSSSYAMGKTNGALEHELTATIRANVAEWAVAKHYKQAWNVPCYPSADYPTRKNLPDVGTDGEVRTVRTRDSIPYWSKDRGKTIIGCKVLDENYYSQVEIYGTFEPQFSENQYDSTNNCYRMPIGELR